MAAHFGVESVVFVPGVDAPRDRGAHQWRGGRRLEWVDGDYDDAVRRAGGVRRRAARVERLVQDTAWDGYEQVPAWIVDGYQTLLDEVDAQLGGPPDLVARPGRCRGHWPRRWCGHYRAPGGARPAVLAVEPDTAACLLTSLTAGRRTTVPNGGRR